MTSLPKKLDHRVSATNLTRACHLNHRILQSLQLLQGEEASTRSFGKISSLIEIHNNRHKRLRAHIYPTVPILASRPGRIVGCVYEHSGIGSILRGLPFFELSPMCFVDMPEYMQYGTQFLQPSSKCSTSNI